MRTPLGFSKSSGISSRTRSSSRQPGETITIRSQTRAEAQAPSERPWLVIQVVDRGIGIEPDLLQKIFNPFEQGGPASERRFGGLGLGLAISRSIALQHGGCLTASSEGSGMGATFTLEFPTVASPAFPTETQTPLPDVVTVHRPLRILLVEDNKDTLKYLSESLIKQGHDVRTASDLAHALRVVAESDFEMLISDIELPDGSGLDLMWKLRSMGDVMGIAVSGFGTSDDISLSHSAGFARHLTKPFEFRRLEEAIQQVAAGIPRRGVGPEWVAIDEVSINNRIGGCEAVVEPGWHSVCMIGSFFRLSLNHPHPSTFAFSNRRSAMFDTKNDLSKATRVKVVELLNARLADCIDLQTQVKQAHWNVKGPSFIALHELFDKINEEVQEYVDEIAERAVQLGGVAEGTARVVAKRSTLTEYPGDAVDGRSHVEALSSALATFGKAARKAIDESNELGDLDTADLFTGVSRGIDKWLWFVEAHHQAKQ